MKTVNLFFALTIFGSLLAQQKASVEVTVQHADGKPYVGDKVFFVGQKTKSTLSGVTNNTGKFLVDLPEGDIYDIRILAIGDEVEYNTIEVPEISADLAFEKMEVTIMYEAPKNYTLNDLKFETGKSTLLTSSYTLLSDLVEIMKLKPDMRIEVSGHTDNEGDEASNLKLSKERAESVKNYLISKGIVGGRITTVGYGETRPVADNSTSQGRAKNRRTEIRIL